MKIAMIDLLETVPFEKITVTKLCQQSQVSRPTFYHHYTSLANLAFEAVLYQTQKAIPGLHSWEDWLENIQSVLLNMKEHQALFNHFINAHIHDEATVFLTCLLKKTIRRQETLLNYHLSPINESFVIRLYSETYMAFLTEFIMSDMTLDPAIITTQCRALLGDAVGNALRGFMRLDQ